MVKVLRKKVVREIRTSYLQYLSVILIAALAVTLFTGIYANYKNFDDRLNMVYEKTNMSDMIITYSGNDSKDEDFLKSLDLEYEKRIYLIAKSGTVGINIIVFDEGSKLNIPTEVSKDYNASDVLVDKNFLERRNINIGDTFDIEYSSYTFSLQVTGTMIHPEALDNSTYSNALIYVGIDAFKDAIRGMAGFLTDSIVNILYNQYVIKCDNCSDIIDKVNEYYESKENNNLLYVAERKNMPSNISIESDVIQAKKMLYVFPVIFYLVAVLIILTSISQLINKEKMNIGIMKSFGYTNREILNHYMSIIISLCLLGSIIGIVLGPLIIPKVMNTKYKYLYQLPQYSVSFFRVEYLFSVLILIIVGVLTSYFVCKEEIHKKPAESLRGENSAKMREIFFEKTALFNKIPLTIRMALRNMRRKISRTLMVVLGLMGCSALLVCGFGIDNTLNYGLNLEIDELITSDISIGYQDSVSKEEALSKIDGVELVEEYSELGITLKKDKIISSSLFLLPDNSQIFNIDYSNEGFVLSSKVADEINAKVGDEVEIIYGNNTYYGKVNKIVDLCITQGVFISKTNIDIEFHPNAAWLKTTNRDVYDSVVDEVKKINNIDSVISNQGLHDRLDNITSTIRVMTMTIKIFAILLAIVVLYNLALLNFDERTRDIATLKVLGFNRIEIGTSLTFEILFSTLIGSLIGLLFGMPLLKAVLSINENPLLTYIYHIDGLTYLYTILLTCGVSIIINTIFAYLTKKVKMVESLKSVD